MIRSAQYQYEVDDYDVRDHNDQEYLQFLIEDGDKDEAATNELLLTPYDKPYRLENWHPEDLVSYVGGIYAKEAYTQ